MELFLVAAGSQDGNVGAVRIYTKPMVCYLASSKLIGVYYLITILFVTLVSNSLF